MSGLADKLFKQIGPKFPFDDRKRLDVKCDDQDGTVILTLDSHTIKLTEHQAKRFSTALWTASNDAEVVLHHNRKRKPMAALT